VNVSYENFPLFVQRLQKFQGISVPTVNTHPVKAHPTAARVGDDFLGQIQLGSMDLLRSGYVGAIATSWVLRPFLREVQSRINETHPIGPSQGTEYSNLAVILFAQPTVPLPRYPNRLIALLRKDTFVDVQSRADFSAEQTVRFDRDPIHDRAILPRGVSQKVLQHLVVTVRDCLHHALHVAFVRLHQAAKILLRRLRDVVVMRAKMLFNPAMSSLSGSPHEVSILWTRQQILRLIFPL
jgi:hypothetical protein